MITHRRRDILELLSGEDLSGQYTQFLSSLRGLQRARSKTYVLGDKVDLGVSVLSSLGGGHVDDLARSSLDDDVTVLPQR